MKTPPFPIPKSNIQAVTLIGLSLIFSLVLIAANAFADNPEINIRQIELGSSGVGADAHVSVTGQFNRSDGSVVRAYHEEKSYGGTICLFTLPNEAAIRLHGRANCLLYTSDTLAELYWFDSSLPIASQVQQFDGYKFTDVTTPGKRWVSILIHLRTYVVQYLITILIFSAMAFHLGKWAIKPNPKRRWPAFFGGVGITILLTIVYFFLSMIMMFSRETFWLSIFFVFLAVGFVLFRRVSKFS